MIAARLHEDSTCLQLDEVPVPSLGPGECLVDLAACGLCGSDLYILDGETPTRFRPITLGHEASGVVSDVAADVDGLAIGTRVIVNPIVVCGPVHSA